MPHLSSDKLDELDWRFATAVQSFAENLRAHDSELTQLPGERQPRVVCVLVITEDKWQTFVREATAVSSLSVRMTGEGSEVLPECAHCAHSAVRVDRRTGEQLCLECGQGLGTEPL